MEDNDDDIEELIKGNGVEKEDLYQKLRKVVDDEKAPYYYEQVDKDGNVYLMEASGNEEDEYGEELM